uniref:GON7 subunit of KEOPS complex n=1 Tax=Panagrellus redivivus TaxID=6233 RepID=A0A7E4ZT11_PANRE
MHETTCTDAGDSCLCCCGPFVPNVANKTCEDLRKLIPGIDQTIDALYELESMESSFGESSSQGSDENANPMMARIRGGMDNDDAPPMAPFLQQRGGPAKFQKPSADFK